MKKILTLLLSLIFCFALLSSCNSPALEIKKQLVIAYSTPSLQNSFWISVSGAMTKEAAKNNVNLIIRDAGSDISKQAADIEDFIQEKVDAILLTPYDSVSLSPSIRNINKAGIPIIIVDIGVNDPKVKYNSLIITDNIKGGTLAGQWLVDYIKENKIANPTVGTIEAQLGAQNARERHMSFLNVMSENNIPVVLEQSADSLRDKAMVVMEDFLQAKPNLTAVFAECDDMALGANQAAKQAQSGTILIGYDGNRDVWREINSGGNIKMDIDQHPEEMGQMAVEMAIKQIRGEQIQDKVTIEPEIIQGSNVQNYLNK